MARNQLYEDITNLINHIEKNLKEPITIDQCARIVNLSKFHLIHMFKNLTGLTLMDYIQARRLSKSVEDLLTSDLRVMDIAAEYTFLHEQSYIRAFKRYFHITPGQYRKNNKPLEIVHPFDLKGCFSINSGIIFKQTVLVAPSINLIGIKSKIVGNESLTEGTARNRAHDFFFNSRQCITNAVDDLVYYGLTWHENKDKSYSYYLPSLAVKDLKHIPEGMTGIQIPPQKYVVFQYIGNHSAEQVTLNHLMDLHNYVEKVWMPNNNYVFFDQGALFFEKVDMKLSEENYCEVELYYPVVDETPS